MFELLFGQLKDKGPAVSIALLLHSAIQLGVMLQSPTPRVSSAPHMSKISTLLINVVGESYAGVTYGRSAILTRDNGKYYLEYSCYSSMRSSTCSCKNFSRSVVALIAERIIKDVEGLKDQGAAAQCCDHPYTTIQIDYGRGQRKMLTLAGDLLSRYEKVTDKGPTIFGLECDPLPPPRPSPTK